MTDTDETDTNSWHPDDVTELDDARAELDELVTRGNSSAKDLRESAARYTAAVDAELDALRDRLDQAERDRDQAEHAADTAKADAGADVEQPTEPAPNRPDDEDDDAPVMRDSSGVAFAL